MDAWRVLWRLLDSGIHASTGHGSCTVVSMALLFLLIMFVLAVRAVRIYSIIKGRINKVAKYDTL